MNEIKLIVDLCLFQAKPQDLPYSPGSMGFAALLLAAAIYVSNPVQEQTSLLAVLNSIVHVAAYGFAIWGALWLRGNPGQARYLAFLGQGLGLLGIVLALSSSGENLGLGMSLVLTAGVLIIISIVFKNLGGLANATARFVQTATAIFGTAAVLQFVTWPFVNWVTAAQEPPDAQLPMLAIVALGVWTFAVAVAVNRHAMEASVGQSIIITLGTQIFTATVIFVLFGALTV
ncbi:MAG TPA: hypothetical protein VK973_14545 [Arenicellales bacterium]|nr:hypothetical protein [Arenicellales bacterium]